MCKRFARKGALYRQPGALQVLRSTGPFIGSEHLRFKSWGFEALGLYVWRLGSALSPNPPLQKNKKHSQTKAVCPKFCVARDPVDPLDLGLVDLGGLGLARGLGGLD